ncbi:glycosyltransferase family 4 protein [Rufibacter roseolus]|uniref:glycosyltransferase family 4 protein n=1 Tax=Rufibacter roseolus TaxID=2817375 RepID=UPI001B308A09|nr:glycosyltransferase family 4 protein [Rufibacter roseolus]
MVILSHPTGNANVRAAARGFQEAGMLSEFRTSIASFPGSALDSFGGIGPLKEIRRRRFDPSLKTVTKTWPWMEAGRLLATKAGLSPFTQHETGLFCIDAVYRKFDRHVASKITSGLKKGANAVYAFEDGALDSFKKAKNLHLHCLYDLPIGYWRTARRLLENERLQKPEWASTLKGLQDSEEKLARKDEELRLADRIFVASQFTAKTLQDYPGALAPIEIIPYGFPPVINGRDYSSGSGSKRLKLLFVGGLSQRKGIADLFAAVTPLGKHVELTIVGRKPSTNCPALDTALANHRWIPSLSHADVLSLMRTQDALVFPSLFEGFGLVISEAMSQGTPVITTERTAGPDLITHDHSGWLVEAGSADALRASIEKLIGQPDTIKSAGKAAMETARKRPWEVYGRELATAVLNYN